MSDILYNSTDGIYVFSGRNFNVLLPRMVRTVVQIGDEVSPRGKLTRELYPCITKITNPLEKVNTIYSRGGNPFFLIAEAAWIMAGRGDVEFLGPYSKAIGQFSDEGYPDFNGAYGVRLRNWGQDRAVRAFWDDSMGNEHYTFDQMRDAYEKLLQDPETRQAVMTLHIPPFDAASVKTNDRPCNIVSMFKIRDGRLNLHQVLRSNDLVWGLSNANIFQWSTILETLAAWLDLPVGEIVFYSDSLHVYLEEYSAPIVNKLMMETREYDVYNDYTPVRMAAIPPKDYDLELERFFAVHDEIMGAFEVPQDLPLVFKDWLWMLRSYRYWKSTKNVLDAQRILARVSRKDYVVAALEFFERNGGGVNKELAKNVLGLNEEDIAYIMHGGRECNSKTTERQ